MIFGRPESTRYVAGRSSEVAGTRTTRNILVIRNSCTRANVPAAIKSRRQRVLNSEVRGAVIFPMEFLRGCAFSGNDKLRLIKFTKSI